jgi:molecular chaperone GrpE
MKNRYYRALADYQNLQRRSAKEVLEARNRGIEDFVKKLLPIIDTMEKAVEQISQLKSVDKKVMDGLEMFSIQFTDLLEKEGLKPIPARGIKFDPNYHEAMCKRCVEDQDDEIVLTEFEKGYTFKERVLRTAKVEINQK